MGLSTREWDQLAYLSALAAQGMTGDRIPLASTLADEVLPAKIEGDIREEMAKKAKKKKQNPWIAAAAEIGGSFTGPFKPLVTPVLRGVGNEIAGTGPQFGETLRQSFTTPEGIAGSLGSLGMSAAGGAFPGQGSTTPAFDPASAAYMKGSSLPGPIPSPFPVPFPGPEPLTPSGAVSPNALASKIGNFSSRYPQLSNAAATAALKKAPQIGANIGARAGARFGSPVPATPDTGQLARYGMGAPAPELPNYGNKNAGIAPGPATVGEARGSKIGARIGGLIQEYGPRIASGLSSAFGSEDEESAALPSFGNTLGLKPQQIATMSGEFREDARAIADRKMKGKEMRLRHQEHLDELKQDVELAKERAKIEKEIAELRETGEWARHGQDLQNRFDVLGQEMENAKLERTSREGISTADNASRERTNAASVVATNANTTAIDEYRQQTLKQGEAGLMADIYKKAVDTSFGDPLSTAKLALEGAYFSNLITPEQYKIKLDELNQRGLPKEFDDAAQDESKDDKKNGNSKLERGPDGKARVLRAPGVPGVPGARSTTPTKEPFGGYGANPSEALMNWILGQN